MAGRAIIELFVKMLNDMTNEVIDNRFKYRHNGRSFLDNFRGEWLDSFDDEDRIFQEFESSEDYVCFMQDATSIQDDQQPLIPKHKTWRENRPTFSTTLYNALTCGFSIMLISTFIGALGLGVIYLRWQTSHLCHNISWKSLPLSTKWIYAGGRLVVVCAFHFWYVLNLTFVFGWSSVKHSWVCQTATIALVLDVLYEVTLLLTGVSERSDIGSYLTIPLNILILVSFCTQSFLLSRITFNGMKKRLLLSLKLASPVAVSTIIVCVSFYEIYPWYNNIKSTWGRFFIATFAPIVGSVSKAFLRILIHRLHYVNHPGTSFILLTYPYLVSALLSRTLQAELDDLELMALLGIVHGIVEVLERSTIVLRDHLDNQIYERCLVSLGAFRTPRSERLTADIALMSMIFETAAVVVTNGCIFLYTVVYEPENANSSFYGKFAGIIVIQVGIEWIFTSISLAIETHFQNMAVFSIWRKKKWLHIIVATSNILITSMYFSVYFLSLINGNTLNCTLPFSRKPL